MYNTFIKTGKTPIVLKSAAFTQGWIGQFAKYEFGKFSNQDAYYNLTYGWTSLGSKPVPEGVADTSLVAILGKIYFEYYYYNGKEWILDFEELNDDYSEDFYTVYKNSLGQRFYESKWNYPPILYTYDESYIYKIMNDSESIPSNSRYDGGRMAGLISGIKTKFYGGKKAGLISGASDRIGGGRMAGLISGASDRIGGGVGAGLID